MEKIKMRAGCMMMRDGIKKRRLFMQFPVFLSGDIEDDRERKQRADKIIDEGLTNMAYQILESEI